MKLGYARVSTHEQNLDAQTDALKAAGAERIFSDTATGANVDRPGLADLIEHVRKGDAVIVWRLDRLARSLKDLIEMSAMFDAKGVHLISLNEGIDTTTPGGKLMFHLMASIAEFERNLIRERTVAGLAAAKARGKNGGRKPVLDDDKRKTVKTLLDAADAKGEDPNFGAIAHSVGASERTIRRFAKGTYAGGGVT